MFKEWLQRRDEGWFFGSNPRKDSEFADLYAMLLKKHGDEKVANKEFDELVQKYGGTQSGKFQLMRMASQMEPKKVTPDAMDNFQASSTGGAGMMKRPY